MDQSVRDRPGVWADHDTAPAAAHDERPSTGGGRTRTCAGHPWCSSSFTTAVGYFSAPWCEQLRQLADAHTCLAQVVDLEGDVRYLVTTRLAIHKVRQHTVHIVTTIPSSQ